MTACPYCGCDNDPGAQYCTDCGKPWPSPGGWEQGDWIFPYDPSMSARHATVRSEDAAFVVMNANSRNGIALAARGDISLRHNSRILEGDKLLRIEIPA